MKTIVLSNMKGGTAKSTTSIALANGLHDHNKRVLLLDMDPQTNAGFMCGMNVLETRTTLFDVFTGNGTIEDAIQPLRFGYDIAICGLKATAADMTFTQLGRERILAEALKPIQGRYDYALIDTSPNLAILTTAAATAADYMIVPLTADPLAIQGAGQLSAFIQNVQRYCNPNLQILGLLLTMYNGRSTLAKSLEGAIQATAASMNTTVFNTRIRRTQALQDATATQEDPYKIAAKANATQDYRELVTEILERIEGKD